MKKINYIKGDATKPIGNGNKIIAHCCNDLGGWGLGFVIALSRRWDAPEKAYRAMSKDDMVLGNVQFVDVEDDIVVANMIGQHQTWYENGIPPIRYDAVRECLMKVNEHAVANNATIHCPRFGAGLAGGDWDTIEKIIDETITVDVTVYDFN
jgi:O-acetyl-ADP-ribose deacetylase (regulator of RNase III)